MDTAGRNGNGQPAESQKPNEPDQVELSNEEKLELENIQLRSMLLDHQRKELAAKQSVWGAAVAQRLGIDLTKYSIDTGSGICKRIDIGGDK